MKTATSPAGRPPAGGASDAAGFTLLEVLLVIGILVLVYALVPSGFFGGSGVELRATARQVADDLRRARGQAIASNQDAAFVLDVENRRYGIVGRGDLEPLPEAVEAKIRTAAEEFAVQGQGRIRFFPDGSSTGGSVTLSGAGRSYEVSVRWLTGEVRLAE